MPPLPDTPTGVVQITHDCAGINFRLELAYAGTAPTTAVLAAIATAARAQFALDLAGLMSSNYNMIQTTARDLAHRATPPGIDTTTVAGARAGTPAPLSVCALVNFTVNRSYRGSKPKVWLPFGTDTDILNQTTWTNAFTSSVTTFWGAYITGLAGQAFSGTTLGGQVCVSYFGPPTVPATHGAKRLVSTQRAVPLVQTVTSHITRAVFGSQRRRL
jgi:hypothetical protein